MTDEAETVSMTVYDAKSVADAIMAEEMPKWKKWVLRKLLPDSFWSAAPQTLVDALPKGYPVMIVDIKYKAIGFDESITSPPPTVNAQR